MIKPIFGGVDGGAPKRRSSVFLFEDAEDVKVSFFGS